MKKVKLKQIDDGLREIILYRTASDQVRVEVFLINETLWLTQERIAKVFGVQRPAITKHLRNIFASGELDEKGVSSILEHTTKHGAIKGKSQVGKVKYYNLDVIIAVGYRVNSKRATQFRIWATSVLKEYVVKGFAMDDNRLKDPKYFFGKDYFEEQLARIRDIRSSERRFYQKITDIYAECSADYDSDEEITREFFATVQNKLHFAVSGQTAAEIINARVSSRKPNMGLTTWKNSPKGKVREADVEIAKNYLSEKELDHLNRIVSMYLDYAELQAKRGRVMYMKDWVKKLDAFLHFNDQDILQGKGEVSHEVAVALAKKEYKAFCIKQDKNYLSDFDKFSGQYLEQLDKKTNDKL